MSDLVCISHLRWDFVWQRPQHLISRLAQHQRIVFVEEPMTRPGEPQPRLEILECQGAKGTKVTVVRLLQPADHHFWIGHGDPLTQGVYARLLAEYLKADGYTHPALWLYTPMALDFVDHLPHRTLIYDVMDELSAFKGAPPELLQREDALLKRADIVFTGGMSLYRSKLRHNANTHLFPSGVEVEHYARAAYTENFPLPQELHGLPRPILGYFGVIDERMDLPLLEYMARAHPEWSIVMVGPVVKIDPEQLPQAPNLYYPGMKSYEELPAYLAHFDIALVPFAMNEATRYLSPTKTLEYLAAHKPVVSTPIPDVVELYGEFVRIGRSPAEFTGHVERALWETEAGRARRVIKEQRMLTKHTWDSIASQMRTLIESHGHAVPAVRRASQPSVGQYPPAFSS
jgi:UDP-galactopyranose mutase